MAGSANLFTAFIELGYKGFDKVNQHMQGAVRAVQAGLNQIGNEMRNAQSHILDFTKAGSPLAFNTLAASVDLLKARIGSSFGPVILSVSKSIQDLSRYIRDLDPETKKQIATWTTLGVVGGGLIAVFGNLALTVGKFGASILAFGYNHPFILGLLALAGAAAKAYFEMDKLAKLKIDDELARKRLASGGMTKDDVEGSWYARQLEKVKDPAERAKRAKGMMESLKAQGGALTEQYDAVTKNPLDAALTGMGGGAKNAGDIAKEMNGINKELQIVANYLNAAVKGESPTVKAGAPKPKKDELMFGAMGGSGGRAGSMSLDSSYSAMNNIALGQNQIQMQMLKEQQMSNKTALESKGKIEGIEQMLYRAMGL